MRQKIRDSYTGTMRVWSPPKGSKVVFRLRSRSGALPLVNLLCSVHLMYLEHGFHRLAVTDPRWQAILPHVGDRGDCAFESCWVDEPRPRPDFENGWFELSPGPGEFRTPARAPESQNYAWRDLVAVASERFVKLVERRNLSGLGWIPFKDPSPDDPVPWFDIYA